MLKGKTVRTNRWRKKCLAGENTCVMQNKFAGFRPLSWLIKRIHPIVHSWRIPRTWSQWYAWIFRFWLYRPGIAFLEGIPDRMCENEREPEFTEIFTNYVELLKYFRRENAYSFLTETELSYLRQKIVKCNSLGKYVFKAYQTSIMDTNLHLLYRSVNSIKHVGGIQSLHGALYEYSHELFKTVYATTSKRRGSATDEAVGRYNEKLQIDHLSGRTGEWRALQNQFKIYVVLHDSIMLFRSDVWTTLVKLESFLSLLSYARVEPEVRSSSECLF